MTSYTVFHYGVFYYGIIITHSSNKKSQHSNLLTPSFSEKGFLNEKIIVYMFMITVESELRVN
jgi:hypothetical protein